MATQTIIAVKVVMLDFFFAFFYYYFFILGGKNLHFEHDCQTFYLEKSCTENLLLSKWFSFNTSQLFTFKKVVPKTFAKPNE